MTNDSFAIRCEQCDATHVVTEARIESKHRSAEGMVGYVRCGAGHLVIHQLAEAYPKPPPPASVIALRARKAAQEHAAERLAAARIVGTY